MKNVLCALLALYSCCSTEALKIGVTAGPHADIVNNIKDRAKDLTIDIIEFNDFVLPNEALASGDLDLNSYQHEPYLNAQVESRGYKIKSIGKTVLMPIGVYSNKIKSLNDLQDGAQIAIPNDPSNGGRALKILAKAGVIKINDVPNPSLLDIRENPKNIKLIELEAPMVPQSIEDPKVDAIISNTDWILLAGIDPQSAIAVEDKDSPYVNVIAVRIGDEDKEDIKKFVALYQSDETKKYINDKYKGAVIPAW